MIQNKTNLFKSIALLTVLLLGLGLVSRGGGRSNKPVLQLAFSNNSQGVSGSIDEFETTPQPSSEEVAIEVAEGLFFNADLFYSAVRKHKSLNSYDNKPRVRGLIVPHHLLASDLIAHGFATVDPAMVETVIIISPNHFEQGDQIFQTSLASWRTPIGIVDADEYAIMSIKQKMQKSRLLAIDDKTLEQEHGVAGLTPFAQRFFPEARLVPIVVKAYPTMTQLESLLLAIQQADEEGFFELDKTLVVGSIDFSHDLLAHQAVEKDKITRKLIDERRWNELLKLNNEYLDSPGSLILTFELASFLGAHRDVELVNTNAAELTGIYDQVVTSYFLITLVEY